MPIDLKSRMVSFRLTSDEYERVRELCLTHGLPSVSEIARTAIHSLLKDPAGLPSQSLEGRVSELESRMKILTSEMRKLQANATLRDRK